MGWLTYISEYVVLLPNWIVYRSIALCGIALGLTSNKVWTKFQSDFLLVIILFSKENSED